MADGQKVPFAGSVGAVKLNVRTTEIPDGLERKLLRFGRAVLSDIIAKFKGS